MDYSLNVSNSRISLPSCSLLSPSTMSAAGGAAFDPEEEESYRASLDGATT